MTKQTVLSRYTSPYGGIDFGGKRRLIAATPDQTTMLFIIEGYQSAACGIRGFGREYHPSRLALLTPGDPLSKTLTEGRISKATLIRYRVEIDAAFGQHIALDLDPRKTQWVTPAGLVEIT